MVNPESIIDARVDDLISSSFEGKREALIETLRRNGLVLEDLRRDQMETTIVVAMRHANVGSKTTDKAAREKLQAAWLKQLRANAFVKIY